ncbi:MAG: pyridoxal-phosphate dependent enzyme [Myxococcales bacterium]|nr:pyridoxal-phosphate dependent enzyme [Myxococcales bacterium]
MSQQFPVSLLDTSKTGVWRYRRLLSPELGDVSPVDVGDLGPLFRRAVFRGVPMVLWREDLCPNGSHKDRSLAVQIALYRHQGKKTVCLSSSGNAAIAAAAACRVAGLRLVVFVSKKMALGKLMPLCRYGAHVIQSERAMSLCNEFSSAFAIPNLRPSMDDAALEGYKTLAFFAAEQQLGIDALVCYSTSGSTLCGISRGYDSLRTYGWTGSIPALVAAQAGTSAAIAQTFGYVPSGELHRSLIGDLGAKRSRRHGEVVRALRAGGGGAVWIDDSQILAAQQWLLDQGVNTSLESACATAAAMRWIDEGRTHHPGVLLTGHYGHDVSEGWSPPADMVSTAEVIADLPQRLAEWVTESQP